MANLRPLTRELQKIACSELNEGPSRVTQDLEDFKKWLEKQPHLKARMDDQFLISFLRGCKYRMEKSKLKIDRYYTLKTKYPEFYNIQNIKDPKVKEILECGVCINLPIPLNDTGPRILYVRPGHYPCDRYSFSDVMGLSIALQELYMRDDDYCVVNGYVQIADLSEFSMGHILQLTPTVLKKISTFAEDAVPLRQVAIHIINTPIGFDKIFNVLKPLMSQKQQKRIFVHSHDLSSLYQDIPQKYLPQEMGGENGSLEQLTQELIKYINKNHKFFLDSHKYRVEEKLRVEKIIDYDHVFGTEGSFRKLNVD